MDFLNPKKKRAHRIRLFIGYGLMSVAIGIATTILVFEAYGFDLDRKTGTVIQNGLLFIDAHPEQAQITLNGEDKGQTDARLVIPDGQYKVELKRDGYRGWKRTFRLEGSSIERLVYPFLFPDKLDSEDTQLYGETPAFSTQSPDRKWVLVQRPGGLNRFDLFDLSQNTINPLELVIADSLFTQFGAGAHKLELAEWATDNRHVLLKHIYPGGFEFIMVDREQPTRSLNVNKTLNTAPSAVTLRDKKFDELYLHTLKGGLLQLGELDTGTVRPLLTDVIAYKTYSTEEILFVTAKDAPAGKVLARIRVADKVHTLRDLPAGDPNYLVEISKFDGAWLMAVGASAEKKAYIYRNPFDILNRTVGNRVPAPETVLKTDNVGRHLSFSTNVRFISLQGGSQFAVYDAEMNKLFRYDTKLPIAAAEKARWMDGHRLSLSSEGKLKVFDFDGSNIQELVSLQGSHLPYFDRDYDRLFSLSPSVTVPNRTAFLLSYMRTAADR
jgi:hypothetical protein